MAGGSEEGLVCGSPPGCAGSGGGRAAGAAAEGEFGGGAGPDGNGGGAVLTGWTASCSSDSGEGSGGDPARRGDGGSVSKRTLSVANSAGAVMGRGGGPAGGRVASGLAILRSELPAAWATGGTGAAGTRGGPAPLVARAARGAGPPRTGSGVLGDGGAVAAGVWMGTSSGLGRLRRRPLFLLMRRSARRATFKSAITSRSDIGSP
jgi:hypothetical protein